MVSEFVNLVTSYARPIKAVGWVYLIVSREYIDCQKKQLWQVVTLPGLDHGINRGGDQENDQNETEGIEINAGKHRNISQDLSW